MKKLHKTDKGNAYPLGATLYKSGVNFSVYSPMAKQVELLLFQDDKDVSPSTIRLDPKLNKSIYYWHIFVEGLKENQLYAYRVVGEWDDKKGRHFDASKVLIDPYGKAIAGQYNRKLASLYGQNNISSCLKSAVINDEFDWDNVLPPCHPQSDSVIYEMHVRGFTKHPSSGIAPEKRGTFSGIIEKIPYLKSLGITAVELMPVFAFDIEDAPVGKNNYWGYSPLNFFALHNHFAQADSPQEIVREFKTMVRELHRAGIEVILDVVYNHTAETGYDGPTYCFRGFANNSYYLLDEKGENKDFSGCGNTLKTSHSVVRRMIHQSLEYWVQQMHVDGFRFDLASVLSRDEKGIPMYNPPILWAIESNPVLADIKLIVEPWDASGLYQLSNFSGDRWALWNDNYRDDIRRFVKGDEGMIPKLASRLLGSPDILRGRHHRFVPDRSVHFVTCHDGFTLNDLVSYNEKHNECNGENNQDGNNLNYSWNCGIEGKTEDEAIEKLRKKQIKNFLTLLFLTQGTPMLLMGDEIRRTQNGNNNAYCQDNKISWMRWDEVEKNQEILEFTKKVIFILNHYSLFNSKEYLTSEKKLNNPYVIWHGQKLHTPDWSTNSRSLACELINPLNNNIFYLIFNAFWEDIDFELPEKCRWKRILDTSLEIQTEKNIEGNSYHVAARSTVLLKKEKN